MRIALLGDIALVGRYDRQHSLDVDKRLLEIQKVTNTCDFVVANLEAPLTSKTTTRACKGVYLRSDPTNVATLKYLGVTHVTLGNNHIFDFGVEGKEDTIRILKENDIAFVGLNFGPSLLECGEDRALLEGFCCLSANGLRYGKKIGRLMRLEERTVNHFLDTAKEMNCLPIISAHYGVEGVHYPSVEHRNMFHFLAEKHDFILHGNHPHAVQGIESFGESLLIYSQGNLCFDELNDTSIKGLVLRQTVDERESIVVVLEIEGSKLKRHEVIGFSDCETGAQKRSTELEERVKNYSSVFSLSEKEFCEIRKNACEELKASAQKRSLSFLRSRLNYRYICAYINGRLHAKKYNKLFSKFMKKELAK